MNGTTDPSSMPQTSAANPAPADAGQLDLPRAVRQLRVLVCWLGLAISTVSLLFNAFVLKQNRDTKAMSDNRAQQLMQLQASQQPLIVAVNELAQYSMGNTELMALFKKYGIELKAPPPATLTNAPPAAPTP